MTTSLAKIEDEFTKVITESDLATTLTQSINDFTTIITKNSLLEQDVLQPPIPWEDLIEYYDHMFPTLETYCKFVNQKLKPWQHTLELKYFDSFYHHQQSTTKSIKRL